MAGRSPMASASLIRLRAPGRARTRNQRRVVPWLEAVLLAIFLVLPGWVPDYLTDFASRLLILALFALSFDLVFGYGGIMSFGQALFFGGAGYVVALLARDLGISSVFAVVPVSLLVG